jgi:hypothetical protein
MKTLQLTQAEVKVFSVLLERATEEMGNHGCNDFSLTRDAGLTELECLVLDRTLREVFPVDMTEHPGQRDNISDFFLLGLLARKIENLL